MDSLERASALLNIKRMEKSNTSNPTQTTTISGTAASDSAEGKVTVNLGGDSVTYDDVQEIEVNTSINVKKGDKVRITLVGADGTAKDPLVTDVVGGGDRQQEEINKTKNYFFHDDYGAHVATTEGDATTGANSLLTSTELQIRDGETVLASYGSSEEHLGKNAKTVKIYMCKDMGMIKFDSGLFNLIPADTQTCVSENNQAGVLLSTGADVAGKKTQLAVLIDENSVSSMQIWADVFELWNNNNTHLHILMSDLIKMITPHTVLYDSTGSNSTIALSQSAANFNHMRIYFHNNDSYKSSVDIYSPNGKSVSLATSNQNPGSTDLAYIKCSTVTISGTSISRVANSSSETAFHSASSPYVTRTMSNFIYIYRVEAWNE